MIRKEGGFYVLFSKTGTKLGTYETEKEAQIQEAIQTQKDKQKKSE